VRPPRHRRIKHNETQRFGSCLAPCRTPATPCSAVSTSCSKIALLRLAGVSRLISSLPALGPKPVPNPVFVLVGGPGLGAASMVTGASEWVTAKARHERDIVFVDQRGTGNSNRLQCRFSGGSALQKSFVDLFPIDGVRACREALAPLADVRLYTTPIAMDDLDDVRAALGYGRINLYGSSYGAQAALGTMGRRTRLTAMLCHRGSSDTSQRYLAAAVLSSPAAQASATARLGSACPGKVAHPVFITNSVWS
jgi:pimeloyl-ACP methyl ester carboxylesterase